MSTARGTGAALAILASSLLASPAHAFCGFYAGSATSELTASASRVVLLRDGTRTVITMQNSYEGPPEHFAVVVPVPVVLSEQDVRALDPATFDRLDTLTAPRVVEYEERPPYCPSPGLARARSARMPAIRAGSANVVTIEAEFSTAEYDIVILGASDSTALEDWLRAHGYAIPEGAADALRPYVAAGTKFFVARVDVSRVRFVDGRAVLSPLRFHYDAPELTLPVRLGVLNSRGEQDLVVYVLAREQRFDVANRENLFAPTNVEVAPGAIARLGELYDALFDRTMERHPDAVVTEYAWAATSCDPCPGPTLTLDDLNALGGDVISGATAMQAGPAYREITRLERVEGHGGNEGALREQIERRLARVEECAAGSTGVVDLDLELTLRADGRLLAPARRSGSGMIACIARRLDGARVVEPPLHVDASRWLLGLQLGRAVITQQTSTSGFTITRLRTRTRKLGRIDDLVLRAAPPVEGGRGEPDAQGVLPGGARRARFDNFQSRFVVLHRREVRAPCAHPVHTGWRVPSRQMPRRPAPSPARVLDLVRAPLARLGIEGSERLPRRGRPTRRRERAIVRERSR